MNTCKAAAAASGTNPQGMIAHHARAIFMSRLAAEQQTGGRGKSLTAEIRRLAKVSN